MKLFAFYISHTFINVIKKMCRTWVAIFIAVCIVMGVIIGIGTAVISDFAKDSPSDDADGTVIELEESDPGVVISEVEKTETEKEGEQALTDEEFRQLTELISGGVILFVLFFAAFSSDKSVASLFLPADAFLLFPSPMKPQSVLIFRLSTQIGTILLTSVYLLFQIPNLIMNTRLTAADAVAILFTWFLTIAWAEILKVFLYVFASTHERFKRHLRTYLFGIVAVIGIAFYRYHQTVACGGLLDDASAFFNGKFGYIVPIWGWLKAIISAALRGKYLWMSAIVMANILLGAAAIYFIWQMRADFYEEALSKCEEKADLIASAKEGRTFRAKEKKDRNEKLLRDGLTKGSGANILYHKAMYNRFRFSHLHFFTKTAETYAATVLLTALFMRFLIHFDSPLPCFGILAAMAFLRSLGNSIEEDAKTGFFLMIPDAVSAKLWYSLLGALVNCALDLLPAMVLAGVLMKVSPLTVILWYILIISLYFYSVCIGAFIDFSVPTAEGKPIKTLTQILFIYFGLLPDALCLILSALFADIWLGILLSCLVNCLTGALFFFLCQAVLANGRK